MAASRSEADITGTNDRPGPECRERFGGSVKMTLQQGFPAALSPARSIPASANRKRLRSTSRVFQSTRGAFGSRDLLSRNPVARIKGAATVGRVVVLVIAVDHDDLGPVRSGLENDRCGALDDVRAIARTRRTEWRRRYGGAHPRYSFLSVPLAGLSAPPPAVPPSPP